MSSACVSGCAGDLGLDVVAEGVETKQVLDDLRALGCDLVQGYYFTEPLEPDELSAWFGRGTPAPTAVRAA